MNSIEILCQKAQSAARALANAPTELKNIALDAIATHLKAHRATILSVNAQDVQQAKQNKKPDAFVDRLTLTPQRFDAMLQGLQSIAAQPDPVNTILAEWTVPSGLHIARISVPLGVIAVIYESRPNVTVDAAALCLKSGNAVILRGGSESAKTNRALCETIQIALASVGLSESAVQYVPQQDRATLDALLKMDDYIDVIIPRGGQSLIEHIQTHSRIPTFSHLNGICHTYVHEDADLEQATRVTLNAKMRRTGICGATETLLVDQKIAESFLPNLFTELLAQGCEIRGCERTCAIDPRAKPAQVADWATEYLDAILSVKVVDDLQEAIDHIQTYSSHHTEAILTGNAEAAQYFLNHVQSAIVMHNASTQFADGGEFGMGAEIGIATGKLHARGPVGLEQLTTMKYNVKGTGQTRPD